MQINFRSLPGSVSLGLLCLFSAMILWQPIETTFSLALHDDSYTHIILILPISAALILSEWNWIASGLSAKSRAGTYLFAVGLLIAGLSRWWSGWPAADVRIAAGMLALVILWLAAFVICFGTNAARRLLFPLSFLFLLIPIPSFLLLKIVQSLQHGSAIAASLLFSAVGVPVSRTGVLVSIPGLTVEVARECSSIRSSLMLLVTTMVLAHVLLRTTWKQMLVVLLVVPLSVAKNGIRIFTLGILATRVDPSYLRGHLHHDGGIIFLMLALAIIGIVIWLLRRHEDVLGKQPSSTSIIAPLVPEFIESKPWI
jgi:exosortase